ncbi:MAG: PH domain-containing protein [Lacisediminihabitans sp.]
MNDSVTLRPRFGKVLVVLVCLIVVTSIGSFVAAANWVGLAKYSWVLLLLGFLSWVAFWAPAVVIGVSEVDIVNLLRTHRITWPSIRRIDTKYALTLYTTAGKVTAWAAPAPGRMATIRVSKQDFRGLPESTYGAGHSIALGDIPSSDSGLASLHVRRRWEQLRDAGHLDGAAVDGTGVVTTWHWTTIAIGGALLLSSVLGIVL